MQKSHRIGLSVVAAALLTVYGCGQKAEEPKNVQLLYDALYEVTGHALELVFALGEEREQGGDEEPESEENVVELMKRMFDAEEVEP